MIKIVLIGAWVCIISLGAVYAAVTLAGGSADSAAAKQEIPPAYVAGEVLSIPVLSGGAVTGYFLTKVSVMVDQDKAAKTHIPMAPYITDELYTVLVGDSMIDLPKAGHFDVEGLRTKIKTDLNAKAKDELVTSVIFEQLDYISKADATGKPSQRTATKKIIAPEPAPAGAAPAKGALPPKH
jgi:flagellar basal body-associated protein FliL